MHSVPPAPCSIIHLSHATCHLHACNAGFGGREERPDRRGGRDEFEPSRAESVDDWGTVKKFVPSEGSRGGFGGGGFGDRRPPGGGGGFGDRYGAERPPMRPSSNADEVDDWGSSKKFEPSAARPGPPGGFRDGPPRRAGFEGSEASRADEEDQWSRGKAFQPTEAPASRGPPAGGRGGFGFSGGAAGEEDRWSRKPLAEPSAAAAAPSNGAPAERPRLKLQPRTVDAAAGAAGSSAADAGKSKSNPFGAARPREEVLKEKGVDPTKEGAKLAPVSRSERGVGGGQRECGSAAFEEGLRDMGLVQGDENRRIRVGAKDCVSAPRASSSQRWHLVMFLSAPG